MLAGRQGGRFVPWTTFEFSGAVGVPSKDFGDGIDTFASANKENSRKAVIDPSEVLRIEASFSEVSTYLFRNMQMQVSSYARV